MGIYIRRPPTQIRSAGRFSDRLLEISADQVHRELYAQLVGLDKANKNGVWARIIKNSFAPLFMGRADYVVGNPPWVFWNNLPEDYRQKVRKVMGDTYGLIKLKASKMGRLGQTGKDISMLFVYVSLDRYCEPTGKLGFVITQTVFQSTAGLEFRRFTLPGQIPFCVKSVHDFVEVQPFAAATNRTATISVEKGSATRYPLDYIKWVPTAGLDIEAQSVQEIRAACSILRKKAAPSTSSSTSPWMILDDGSAKEPVLPSDSGYKPRKGLQTGAEGVYRVQIMSPTSGGFLVQNDVRRTKRRVDPLIGRVERDLLYPFTNGSSASRWRCRVAGYYIVPHTSSTGMNPIDETTMRRRYGGAYDFLSKFRSVLAARAIHKLWGAGHPFYSVYNVGPYTFSPWKVVWKRIASQCTAAVISSVRDDILGDKLLVPNESLMALDFAEPNEAHFVCGVLSCSVATKRVNASVAMQAHSEILEIARVPHFDKRNATHMAVSRLARACHAAAAKDDEAALGEAEEELNKVAATLWA